jgi:hypothetical protein
VASLAQSNGGITAAASCASDSSAFSGRLVPEHRGLEAPCAQPLTGRRSCPWA